MKLSVLFLILFASFFATAEDPSPALWEYGIGAGYLRYWHYPASDQTRDLYIPFPTFIYRGEILRADDRDGAKAYLWRGDNWNLEFGGGVLPSIKSDENYARQGMEDLPWGIQVGPQWIYNFPEGWELKIGLYQALLTDFKWTKIQGLVNEIKLSWYLSENWERHHKARIALNLKGASQEFMQTYYTVEPKYAHEQRPAYEAKGGFLAYGLSYFQSIHIKKYSFYVGATQSFYDLSVNKESPLHKSDKNFIMFCGITYTLGESQRKSVPEENAEGLIEKVERRWKMQ